VIDDTPWPAFTLRRSRPTTPPCSDSAAERLLAAAERETARWREACEQLDALPWWAWRRRARLRADAEHYKAVGLYLLDASADADGDLW